MGVLGESERSGERAEVRDEVHLYGSKGVVGLTTYYRLTKTSFIFVTSSHLSLCALLVCDTVHYGLVQSLLLIDKGNEWHCGVW